MLNDIGIETSRGALRELMRRAARQSCSTASRQSSPIISPGCCGATGCSVCLLDTAARPAAREIVARAEAATEAFLRAYPAP